MVVKSGSACMCWGKYGARFAGILDRVIGAPQSVAKTRIGSSFQLLQFVLLSYSFYSTKHPFPLIYSIITVGLSK